MKKSYILKPSIKAEGYPVTSKKYKNAHHKANECEKKKYGKENFEKLKQIEEHLPEDELLGSHTKDGKRLISRKTPPKYRDEVDYHEKIEHEIMENNRLEC